MRLVRNAFILSFFAVCNLNIKEIFQNGSSHLSWDMGIVSQKYLEGNWGDVNLLMKSLTISRCHGGANNLLYRRSNSTISWHLWGVPSVGLVAQEIQTFIEQIESEVRVLAFHCRYRITNKCADTHWATLNSLNLGKREFSLFMNNHKLHMHIRCKTHM